MLATIHKSPLLPGNEARASNIDRQFGQLLHSASIQHQGLVNWLDSIQTGRGVESFIAKDA